MQVSVEFLGRTRILTDGRELALSRQNITFLAYLVLNREVDHPREVLIEQFWSSCEPARGRSCLGTALSRLRKKLKVDGPNWLEVSPRGEPRISQSAAIWFDIVAFEAAVAPCLTPARGPLDPALLEKLIAGLAHYHGDLLLGWYDDWVLTERERLRVLCLRGYRCLMDHYAAIGDFDSAISAGHSALRIEPLQELVQQRVIELYHLSGQTAAALRQYDRLTTLLRNELDVAPSKSTRAIVERIRAEP